MRSLLFAPADSERKLAKAFASGADAVIVDLEDSVAPERKAEARAIARSAIEARQPAGPIVYVRVNDLASGMTDDDLAGVLQAGVDGIMLPKANGHADVEHLAAKLRVHEAEAAIADGLTRIIPIATETAAGVLAAGTYAVPSPRLAGLTWGAEDLSVAVGARTTRDDAGRYTDLFRLARSMALLAAAAAGVPAIDTVYPDFRDAEGFEADCRAGERDGFTARMAIHPSQVAIINAVFTPDAAAIARARRIVDAFAAAGDPGVLAIDGKMYDRPHLRLAQRLLARAEALTSPAT